MRTFLSTLLYIIVIFSFLQSWWLLFVLSLTVFSIQFGAVALIPIAILFDGYFGNYFGFPYLSFFAILWFVAVEFIRPKIIDLDQERV